MTAAATTPADPDLVGVSAPGAEGRTPWRMTPRRSSSAGRAPAVAGYAVACGAAAHGARAARRPGDRRPRTAIDAAQAFVDGAERTKALRDSAWAAHRAAQEARDAGQAARATLRAAGRGRCGFLHPLAAATQVRPAHQQRRLTRCDAGPVTQPSPESTFIPVLVQGLAVAERAGQVHEAEQDVGVPLVADLHPWAADEPGQRPSTTYRWRPSRRWTRCRAWRSSGVIRAGGARRPRGQSNPCPGGAWWAADAADRRVVLGPGRRGHRCGSAAVAEWPGPAAGAGWPATIHGCLEPTGAFPSGRPTDVPCWPPSTPGCCATPGGRPARMHCDTPRRRRRADATTTAVVTGDLGRAGSRRRRPGIGWADAGDQPVDQPSNCRTAPTGRTTSTPAPITRPTRPPRASWPRWRGPAAPARCSPRDGGRHRDLPVPAAGRPRPGLPGPLLGVRKWLAEFALTWGWTWSSSTPATTTR